MPLVDMVFRIHLRCDGPCGSREHFTFSGVDLLAALSTAERDGWTTARVYSPAVPLRDWRFLCPTCAEDEMWERLELARDAAVGNG